MADVSLGAIAQTFMPHASTIYTILIWICGILIFGILVGVGTWVIIDQRRYSRIIPIYEDRNGVLYKIGDDKARIITIDKGLAKVWYLKKLKVPCQAMTLSSGKNTYPVIRKTDGDLINCDFRIDAEGKQVIGRVMPTGIRMANANMRRYFRETYKKDGFMDKYGKTIMFIAEMVIFGVVLILILSEVAKLIPQLNAISSNLAQALTKVTCTPKDLGVV